MGVQQLRDFPRTLLDLEVEDLQDVLLDRWILEGFTKIARRVRRWPHYERKETFFTVADQAEYTLDQINPKKVRAMIGPRGELSWIEDGTARGEYWWVTSQQPASWPRQFATFADEVILYPTPDDAYEITVLGQREPTTDWLALPSGEPDLPSHLHEVLLAWVLYHTYLHQDDPEMASIEKGNFEQTLDEMIADEVSATASPAGLVMGGGSRGHRLPDLPPRQPYSFE